MTVFTKIHEQYTDPKADVYLVSSDGVTFQVHSRALKVWSKHFRSKLPSGYFKAPIMVQLHDVRLETEEVLLKFLTYIKRAEDVPIEVVSVSGSKDFRTDDRNYEAELKFIGFAKKYGCQQILDDLGNIVREQLQAPYTGEEDHLVLYPRLFIYAAILNDIKLAAHVIAEFADHVDKWFELSDMDLTEEILENQSMIDVEEGGIKMDFQTWSWELIEMVPTRWGFALDRAYKNAKRVQADKMEVWKVASRLFEIIMKKIEKTETEKGYDEE